MRKISYTQMRAELSDILDAIRNGETVVVTQRGRPDTVLNGSLQVEHVIPGGLNDPHWRLCMTSVPDKTESSGWHQDLKLIHDTIHKISFDEALQKTQTKHAKIIKALEDK